MFDTKALKSIGNWMLLALLLILPCLLMGCSSDDIYLAQSISSNSSSGFTGNITLLNNESLSINFISQTFILTHSYCEQRFINGILINTTC